MVDFYEGDLKLSSCQKTHGLKLEKVFLFDLILSFWPDEWCFRIKMILVRLQ